MTRLRHVLAARSWVLLGIAIATLGPCALAQEASRSVGEAASSELPSPAAIKACFADPRAGECLDRLFREALKTHSTLEVLQSIARYEAEDTDLRRDCHPVVHAIGRETFRLKGTIHDSFAACDPTCHSGCYHGSVERFLLGDELYAQTGQHPSQAQLMEKAASACDPGTPARLRFQCLHGLGHALMFFAGYDLIQALAVCDSLPGDWSQAACYSGVFMENVFNSTNEEKNFSATDYHYPCNQLENKYRGECYMMQTTRMKEMGLATEGMMAECAKAGIFTIQCTQSIGRDLSNAARVGESRQVAAACEIALAENRLACMHGVVYALIDNTWDARYAFPFCATFKSGDDSDTCIKESINYLRSVFEKSGDDILKDCNRYAVDSRRCMELATRQ